MLFNTKYIYSTFKGVFLTLWEGANKTTTANQAFCSPGEHDGKDLLLLKWLHMFFAALLAQLISKFLLPAPKFWYFSQRSGMTVTPLQTRAQK